MSEIQLDIKDLRVHYNKFEALKGVSLQVPKGSIVALLGANGSGKSTIFKTISGLMRPTSGSIWFEGERIDTLHSYEILARGISHVPERRRLFPYMTVVENLKMGAYLQKNKKQVQQRLEELSEWLPILKEKRNEKVRSLSGGVQQMVAIGRSLMARPKLLLLDEPVQGLSPLIVGELWKIIKSINGDGITIMLIEHSIRFALDIAYKVFILDNGLISIEGYPEELSHTEYVKKIYLGM